MLCNRFRIDVCVESCRTLPRPHPQGGPGLRDQGSCIRVGVDYHRPAQSKATPGEDTCSTGPGGGAEMNRDLTCSIWEFSDKMVFTLWPCAERWLAGFADTQGTSEGTKQIVEGHFEKHSENARSKGQAVKGIFFGERVKLRVGPWRKGQATGGSQAAGRCWNCIILTAVGSC